MKHLILAAALAVAPIMAPMAALAEGVLHKVAVHVDDNDPHVMNMALNNVQNLINYYESQGDTAEVEIVTYGRGIHMLVDGKSPVADRVSTMSLEHENVRFSVCGNTYKRMSEKAGKDLTLLDEATMVPSGAVRLIELQEGGYAYLRP
ncbi:DsrE family protein [Rhodalgimonas zhirmunskyi]|uniref:DsrE family protein n=1 Tax=Rhodalgimonas zhirmunskyi TaxID=2964767 RepID=A0AAJ1X5X2_9RHOB|nr:DsrE family protein [Rhodoalgimonas zhirmunskyi]MDQ2095678.1 DsrE family protein [Rhodoalgimonas zhirmunskyi]